MKNERDKRSFLVFEGLFTMVKLPDDLTDEQVQSISSHTTDTTHPPFHDAPETLDVVGVDVAPDHFTAIVVDVLVNESAFPDASIHLEAVRVELSFLAHLTLDDVEKYFDVELLLLELDIHLACISTKEPDNGQFIRSMSTFALDPTNVQLLILSLSADIRLIHLTDTVKRIRSIHCHDNSKMMCHLLCSLETHARFFCHTFLCTLAQERRDDLLPRRSRDPEA